MAKPTKKKTVKKKTVNPRLKELEKIMIEQAKLLSTGKIRSTFELEKAAREHTEILKAN